MSSLPIVVVAGVPNLAGELTRTSMFPAIHEATTASRLRGLVTGPELQGVRPDRIVFITGDALIEDDPALPLVEFLRKLTTAGYQVVVVSVTARGADLQRQNPRALLLTLPLRMNSVLFAISNFGYALDPVAGGDVEIPVTAAPPTTPSPAAPSPLWVPAPTEPVPAVRAPMEPAVASTVTPVSSAPSAPSATPAGWQRVGVDGIAPVDQPHPTPVAQPSPAASPFAPSPVRPGSDWTPPARRSLADLAGRGPAAPVAPTDLPAAGWPQSPGGQPAQPAWSQSPGSRPPGPASRTGTDAYVARPPRRGFVTTVTVSKGGTGKSSMTLNLAAFLGMRLRSQGKTVCVIDANTQQSDAGKYLDVYTPNINTIVNDPSLLTEDRILSSLVHRPEYNLSVLLGPPTPDEANPLAISARLYAEVLTLLKKHFDYIFIDTPVAEKFHEMFSDFALPLADFIIVPVIPSVQTLHNADNWLRAAVVAPKHEGGAAIDRNRIGIVLNRAEEGIGFSEADVRATMANWHFIGAIPETKEWKAANNANELVAPKNYANLSHAFAEVLHASTREPALLENFATMEPQTQRGGILSWIRGRR